MSANGDVTFTNIPRKLKSDINLKNIVEDDNNIRRTKKGELVLGLKANNERFAEKNKVRIKSPNPLEQNRRSIRRSAWH